MTIVLRLAALTLAVSLLSIPQPRSKIEFSAVKDMTVLTELHAPPAAYAAVKDMTTLT
jgi:hypothetical protein